MISNLFRCTNSTFALQWHILAVGRWVDRTQFGRDQLFVCKTTMPIAGLCLQVEPIVRMTAGWKILIGLNFIPKNSIFQAPPLHSIFVPPDFPAQAVPDLLKRYILLSCSRCTIFVEKVHFIVCLNFFVSLRKCCSLGLLVWWFVCLFVCLFLLFSFFLCLVLLFAFNDWPLPIRIHTENAQRAWLSAMQVHINQWYTKLEIWLILTQALNNVYVQAGSLFQTPMLFQNPPPRLDQHHQQQNPQQQQMARPEPDQKQRQAQPNQDFRRNQETQPNYQGRHTHPKVTQSQVNYSHRSSGIDRVVVKKILWKTLWKRQIQKICW